MLLTQLIDQCQEALQRAGDIPVIIEILDHGSMEQLEPTTTFIEHADISEGGKAKALFITAIITK